MYGGKKSGPVQSSPYSHYGTMRGDYFQTNLSCEKGTWIYTTLLSKIRSKFLNATGVYKWSSQWCIFFSASLWILNYFLIHFNIFTIKRRLYLLEWSVSFFNFIVLWCEIDLKRWACDYFLMHFEANMFTSRVCVIML